MIFNAGDLPTQFVGETADGSNTATDRTCILLGAIEVRDEGVALADESVVGTLSLYYKDERVQGGSTTYMQSTFRGYQF